MRKRGFIIPQLSARLENGEISKHLEPAHVVIISKDCPQILQRLPRWVSGGEGLA